jgi:hypothetical protein
MTASRRRIGSLEFLERRQMMAADVAMSPSADLPETPTTIAAKPAGEMGAVSLNHAAANLPASALDGDSFRSTTAASPTVQDAALTDAPDSGVAYELARCFVKSWSTSGDADAPFGEDINIGVGELQECTISKSMDAASTRLAQFAINGNSLGTAQIDFVEVAGGTSAADDRPTEEVAFYYNKIAFQY